MNNDANSLENRLKKANVELVFEPPWTMDLMSNEAKLELNMTDSFNI